MSSSASKTSWLVDESMRTSLGVRLQRYLPTVTVSLPIRTFRNARLHAVVLSQIKRIFDSSKVKQRRQDMLLRYYRIRWLTLKYSTMLARNRFELKPGAKRRSSFTANCTIGFV